jgi:hypothetical protein
MMPDSQVHGSEISSIYFERQVKCGGFALSLFGNFQVGSLPFDVFGVAFTSIPCCKGNVRCPRKKTFLDRVIDRVFALTQVSKGKPHAQKRSLQVETLESRELLSVVGFHSAVDAFEGGESGYVRLQKIQFLFRFGRTILPLMCG